VTAELAATVVPLELGTALVRVNTDRDGAAAEAVAEVAGIVGVRPRGSNQPGG
jgi:hypothetical protein